MIDPGNSAQPGHKRFNASAFAQAVLIVVAIIAVAWLTVELTPLLLLMFASIIIAAIFDALAGKISALTKIRRSYALVASVLPGLLRQ